MIAALGIPNHPDHPQVEPVLRHPEVLAELGAALLSTFALLALLLASTYAAARRGTRVDPAITMRDG